MHLPGPIRAAVGLVASAAEEARHLPDKAIELPMLAVSTALQASLRAQQRYARYAALGDQVLNRRAPTEEPPSWATFDDPVPVEELRRTALKDTPNGFPSAGSLLDDIFGVDDPTAAADRPKPKKAAKKSATKRAAAKSSTAKATSTKPAAKKTQAKTVSKPKHTASSAFDNVPDDGELTQGPDGPVS